MSPPGYKRRDLIPNQPLRDAYVAARSSGTMPSYVCELLGWSRKDTSRLHRRLGLMPTYNSVDNGGGKTIQHVVDRDIAVAICDVLGLDFDELYEDHLPQEPAAHCKTCGNPMLRRHVSRECGLCLLEREDLGRLDYAVAA